jgi:hypothetical protein
MLERRVHDQVATMELSATGAGMQTTKLLKVTVVAEAVLRERLIAEIMSAGATGYTSFPAEGEGSRHLRSGDLPGENVHIETIVNELAADRLLTQLANHYFPHFALIAYVTEVRVIRGEKYV